MARTAKLLLDEHIWLDLAAILRERGYDVHHINEIDARGFSDEDLLALAAREGYAVLTFNVRHFVPLVAQWFLAGKEHAGVILSAQIAQGELLERTQRMLEQADAESLRNTARWLQEF